jgi:tetratricopeptide (TPR) repeat protein
MSRVAFQKNDFVAMLRQKSLSLRDAGYALTCSLVTWMTQQKIDASIVMRYRLSDFQFIEEKIWYLLMQSVVVYPMYSPRWCAQWQRIREIVGEHKLQGLLEIALQMKLKVECFGTTNDSLLFSANYVQTYLAALFEQKKWDEMQVLLKNLLQDPHVESREKSVYYLWLMRVKSILKEDLSAFLLEALQSVQEMPIWVDSVLKTWLLSMDANEVGPQIRVLQKFFRKRQWHRWAYYLRLVEIEFLIKQNQVQNAQQKLQNILLKLPENLKKNAHLLLAKIHFLQDPPHYRLIADDLNEAKKCALLRSEIDYYTSLQADLYFLDEDYNRAYYLYQELLWSTLAIDVREELAYKWILSGILCEETQQEIQQQLDVCSDLSLLTPVRRAELKLVYAQHLLDRQDYEQALLFLEQNELHFLKVHLWDRFTLLKGKCLLQLDDIDQALEYFSALDERVMLEEDKMELTLLKGLVFAKLGEDTMAEQYLQRACTSDILSTEMIASALFEWVQILAQKKAYMRAQQILLDFVQGSPAVSFAPFALLQAATYCEKRGLLYAQETLQILQQLLDHYPQHPICLHARIKQGTLLMNLNQMEAAKNIFADLSVTATEISMRAFCELCWVRCELASLHPMITHCMQRLENILAQKDLPLSLYLEVTLQLAYMQVDYGEWNVAQKLLWDTCYPFLQESDQEKLNSKEIYWLTRCLLVLAQHTKDPNVARQIYTLMLDAKLLDEQLVKQYLEQVE